MNCKNKIELVWIYSEKGKTVFDLSANVYVRIADDVYMKMMHAFYINSRFLYRIEKNSLSEIFSNIFRKLETKGNLISMLSIKGKEKKTISQSRKLC